MSVKMMGLVWDLDNSIIDREEKYILLAYADHADHQGCNIYPSIETISQKTGYKERATQMITHSLEEKGFLVEDGRGPKGTNKWRIPLADGGAKIAPAKNAGVQFSSNGGAKPTVQGGAPANAPDPSGIIPEPSEEEKELKNSLLKVLNLYAAQLFPDYTSWHPVKLRLEKDDVSLTGNEKQITISGLSERKGQFSLAEIWEEKYCKSFAQHGLELIFME